MIGKASISAILLVLVQSEAVNLRTQIRLATTSNNPVCYEILDSWWQTRENQKTREDTTDLDDICATFTGNENLCMNADARQGGPYTQEQLTAACTMVGAHSDRCIGNPCNWLNTGDCTFQGTGGVCLWYSQASMQTNNNYWNSMASQARAAGNEALAEEYEDNVLPGYGCYRNPCNKAGLGKSPQSDCNNGAYDTPGVVTCTWCKGNGDPQLQGQGMGCQATVSTSTAECAYVNNNSVEKSSVYMEVADNQCQCSNTYPICEEVITSRSGYVPRY